MKNIALLGKNDRIVLFSQTAEKMKMHPSIVEKDFWVCFMLDHLFHDCMLRYNCKLEQEIVSLHCTKSL